MTITKKFKDYDINCTVVQMGKDFNVSIYGGDVAHIGAVALGVPRQSLEDKNKISSHGNSHRNRLHPGERQPA